MPSQCIGKLCSLLGYSRQSYYQGKKYSQQKVYESDIIIEEVLRYRKLQKRLGTRKLFFEMQPFFKAHQFQIGRDALFTLLSERGLLIKKT
jgi:putative transposase